MRKVIITAVLIAMAVPVVASDEVQKMELPPFTFEGMIGYAPVIVIAKVDSMWVKVDTIEYVKEDGEQYFRTDLCTHLSAEIIDLYALSDSVSVPEKSIHIAYPGGYYPDGTGIYYFESPKFSVGDVFLAGVEDIEDRWINTGSEKIFWVLNRAWKYTIVNDSICGGSIALDEAIERFSSQYERVGRSER